MMVVANGHGSCWHEDICNRYVHCSDVIMSAMASQITGITIIYSTVCSGVDQRKHQRSASLAFVRGIHRWPVNSPRKGPVTRKMFPFDDVIMFTRWYPLIEVTWSHYHDGFSETIMIMTSGDLNWMAMAPVWRQDICRSGPLCEDLAVGSVDGEEYAPGSMRFRPLYLLEVVHHTSLTDIMACGHHVHHAVIDGLRVITPPTNWRQAMSCLSNGIFGLVI